MHESVSVEIFGTKYECIRANSSLWFTQKTIARMFGATKQNISLHTADLSDGSLESISKRFTVLQVEGKRCISRELVHFNIGTLAAIALRARRYDIHKEVLKAASTHDFPVDEVPVRSRKEWDFGVLLLGALRGITPIVEQHRFGAYYADFYFPELRLVVEFDELHHKRPKRAHLDSSRQAFIEGKFGVKFLRVQYKQEVDALNQILKIILAGNESGTNRS